VREGRPNIGLCVDNIGLEEREREERRFDSAGN